MSFKQNDIHIHTGNYEEFFILYVDRELSDAQMKQVDEFLSAHPGLQAEFDLLVSTRLPKENFSFDKTALMAENMHPGSVMEDLLLYLDQELPADKKNIIEFELASNKDYQEQYQVLQKTKLDDAETIIFPHKKDLYRQPARVRVFQPWMRVAAAVMIIATAGVLFLINNGQDNTRLPAAGSGPLSQTAKTPAGTQPSNNGTTTVEVNTAATSPAADIKTPVHTIQPAHKKMQRAVHTNEPDNLTAYTPSPNTVQANDNSTEPVMLVSRMSDAIPARNISRTVAATLQPLDPGETINKSPVTSILSERTTVVTNNEVASNKKGSVKGFLRKATRLIEKRTGFDPTNDNGELLIGVVAVKLN
jgi:hypothetical protein